MSVIEVAAGLSLIHSRKHPSNKVGIRKGKMQSHKILALLIPVNNRSQIRRRSVNQMINAKKNRS